MTPRAKAPESHGCPTKCGAWACWKILACVGFIDCPTCRRRCCACGHLKVCHEGAAAGKRAKGKGK